jgi:hypothetical protein
MRGRGPAGLIRRVIACVPKLFARARVERLSMV